MDNDKDMFRQQYNQQPADLLEIGDYVVCKHGREGRILNFEDGGVVIRMHDGREHWCTHTRRLV